MSLQFCHYTTLGLQYQPSEADAEGFLPYRAGFEERYPKVAWTDAERLLAERCEYIAAQRRGERN